MWFGPCSKVVVLLFVACLVNMIQETIQSDEIIPPESEMNDQELAEFERDYARWCFELELDRIQILNNKESRND